MAILPDKDLLDGTKSPATTHPEMSTAMGTLRDFLAGLLGTDSTDKAAAAAAMEVEPELGNPTSDGQVLSSTVAGVRSWTDASGAFSGTDSAEFTVGGLPSGTALTGLTLDEILNKMVYGEPAITSLSLTQALLEVGDSMSTSDTMTIAYRNQAEFTDGTLDLVEDYGGANTPIFTNQSLTPLSRAVSLTGITRTTAGSKVYRATADTSIGEVADTYNVNWRWRIFYGNSVNASLSSAEIIALSDSTLTTSGVAGSYDFIASSPGTYKYICVDSSRTISSVTSGGFTVPMEAPVTVSVTNSFGQTTNYKVYRTSSKATESATFVVT